MLSELRNSDVLYGTSCAREVKEKKSVLFLNNQPDAHYPILFCYTTLHVSGIFFAHHQEFSTVHSLLVSFMQFYDDRFQVELGWNWSLILTLLETLLLFANAVYPIMLRRLQSQLSSKFRNRRQ